MPLVAKEDVKKRGRPTNTERIEKEGKAMTRGKIGDFINKKKEGEGAEGKGKESIREEEPESNTLGSIQNSPITGKEG